jgi:hypothetical protein
MSVEILAERLALIRRKIASISDATVDPSSAGLPGRQLSKEIVRCKSIRTDPMSFDSFVELYGAILSILDPDSLLRRIATAYLTLPNYECDVTVCIGTYTGIRPYSMTRESKNGGFMRPYRIYSAVEISYKWAVTAMIVTMPMMVKEIANIHDFASIIKHRMRGNNCNDIREIDGFDKFVKGYQTKYQREYLTSSELTDDDLRGLMYKMILFKLGNRECVDVKTGKTITHQNLPRDLPTYTKCYHACKNDLENIKRKLNNGFSTIAMQKTYDVSEALRRANESLKEQNAHINVHASNCRDIAHMARASSRTMSNASSCASNASSRTSNASSRTSNALSCASNATTISHAYYSECTTCRDREVRDISLQDDGPRNIDLSDLGGGVININITGGNVTIHIP